ncbi:MAG: hypothetical protein ACRDIZ_12480 [Actinomycetota bacterium]
MFAVVAAIGLVACSGPRGTPRVENATAPAPAEAVDAKAEEVATGFIDAYGAFDVEQANTYLAADADIADLIGSVGAPGVEGTLEEFRLYISLLDAQGYKQMLHPCEETGSLASGTGVRCTFDFHAIRSDEIGLGPFSGGSFDLTVRDGEIVRASVSWGIEEFSPQMWEPFAEWVSTTHSEDAAVMYADGTYSGARLTEESIQLWEKRSREYVKVELAKMAPMVEIVESFMEARNAYDAEKAMSLLADGATALLMYDNAMEQDMPTVRLDREELALALDAERLYGVRYEPFECQPDPVSWADTQIRCSYRMDNKLRQIDGFPPVKSSFDIGVRNDRITNLSFPWLNVGFPAGKPAEGANFVEWVEAAHPEVGGIQGGFHDGELFRIMGQEVVLILTPDSIDLLAGYLEEYERSRNG